VIELLIFDLCDTVVRTAGVGKLLELPGVDCSWDADSLDSWFQVCTLFHAYERGQADTATFVESLRTAIAPGISADVVASAYQSLVLHEIHGMAELLEQLHGRIPMVALSNNNPLLWRGTQLASVSLHRFQRVYLSHETGYLKPEAAAFTQVLDEFAVSPSRAMLVDDNPQCIAAGSLLGLATTQFRCVARLREALRAAVPQLCSCLPNPFA
jgi:glucose-1-phosphatase